MISIILGFLGAHAVSTNNGLESVNGVIKKYNTLKKRLSIPTFIENAFAIVKQWSHRRDPSTVNFLECARVCPIIREDYESAYNFIKESRTCRSVSKNGFTTESIKKIVRQNFIDFEDFISINVGIIRASIPQSGNYEQSSCLCTQFYKKHKCKHIIGTLSRRDLYPNEPLSIPQEAKTLAIG